MQDAWLRWQTCDRSVVLDPLAFLTTTTKRLCINTVQSARARHETHIGSWLPEPVDRNADPQRRIEQCEALELAALTLLERLSPPERAAYVLREAFDYSYAEIASDRRGDTGERAPTRQPCAQTPCRRTPRGTHRRGAEAAGGGVDGRRAIGRPGDPGKRVHRGSLAPISVPSAEAEQRHGVRVEDRVRFARVGDIHHVVDGTHERFAVLVGEVGAQQDSVGTERVYGAT